MALLEHLQLIVTKLCLICVKYFFPLWNKQRKKAIIELVVHNQKCYNLLEIRMWYNAANVKGQSPHLTEPFKINAYGHSHSFHIIQNFKMLLLLSE